MGNNLIKKILREAKLENDLNKSVEAKNILNLLNKTIMSYNGDTENMAYNDEVKVFYCKLEDDLEFMLFDNNSQSKAAINAKERGSEGMYNKKQNRIYFFNCHFKYDESKNKIIDFNTNVRSLYHEIIHYLDLKNTPTEKFKGSPQKLENKEDYLNQTPELNAHWFERIMPLIEQLVSGGEETRKVIKQHGFETFKKIVFNHEDVFYYYQHLYPKNKKRFLKRLAEYYQKLVKENE